MNKVLLVGPSDEKYKGGQVTHCKNLISGFHGSNSVSIKFHANGVGAYDAESFFYKIFRFLSKVPALLSSIIDVNIVHINTTLDVRSTIRDCFIALFCKFCRVSYVVQIHGGSFERIQHSFLAKNFAHFFFRNSVKTLFFFKGEYFDSFIPIEKQCLAYNFLPVSKIQTQMQRVFSGENIKLLYLGRIEKNKGLFELINWLSSSTFIKKISELVVAGDGPDCIELKIKCESLNIPVRFVGFVDAEEKANLLTHSDFLLLPSYAEAFPYTIIEAMEFGLPVISTAVGAIPRIIRNFETGFLLDSLSVDSFDVVFDYILSGNFDYSSMSRSFYNDLNKYDKDAMINFFTKTWSDF